MRKQTKFFLGLGAIGLVVLVWNLLAMAADGPLSIAGGTVTTSVTNVSATATNLGTLTFPTNAGSVVLIDLPVASAAGGTLEAYALQLAGTNAISIRAGSDGTSVTNPVITMEIPTMWFTNSLASWPKIPVQAGATALVFSNGLPYWLFSTNGAGGGSTTWTATNRVFQ